MNVKVNTEHMSEATDDAHGYNLSDMELNK